MAAQAAKDAGIPIYYSPVGLTFPQEVVVEQLLLPNEVKFGEPFYAKAVVNSVKEAGGRLSLYRNGEFLGSQVVRLNAGKNVLTYRQSLEQAGVHVYQALVEVEGDVIEENNRAIGLTVVRGKPQVLLVDKEEAQAPEPGQRPALPVHRRQAGGARRPALHDGRPREVRRCHPVERLLAQDVAPADDPRPRLRPGPGRRADHDRRRGELRPRRLLPHARSRRPCRSPWR